MDRVLKAPVAAKPVKTRKTEGFRFLVPGDVSWEVWNRTAMGGTESAGAVELAKLENRWNASSFLAIPVRYTVVAPLWLATTDRSLMSEMIWLQLERKGLLHGTRDQTAMDYRVVREDSGRSLLSVFILSEHFPEEELCIKGLTRYVSVMDLLELPSNQLVLWRELGQQVFVFTSGTEAIYAQSLPSPETGQALAQETLCALLQLQTELVLDSCSGVVALGSYSRQELDLLGKTLGVPVTILPGWKPQVPASPHNLMPYPVRVLQENRKRSGRFRKMALLAGIFYFLGVSAFLGHYGWLLWQKKNIEKDLAQHQAEVQTIRDTAGRWESMELAILPETYPVEVLFRCTRHLPEEGVRLVTFDQTGTRVLMTGEAKSSSAAFQFLQDLKKSPDLAGYQWEMPPPKLLPSDAAQFQIEGKRSYAPTNSQ